MRRALAFVVRNWPLKLAAVVLATLLYAGLVVSQDTQTFRGRIPVDYGDTLPADAVLIEPLRDVEQVEYISTSPVAPTVDDFRATVDLSNVDPSGGPTLVRIDVESLDPRIDVISWSPDRLQVDLDPFIERSGIEVVIDRGTTPTGVDVGETTVEPPTVTVSGPESVVSRVAVVRGAVPIPPTGLDVDQEVELRAYDANDQELAGLEITPSIVRVTIPVFTDRQTRTLPVDPVVTGTPAAGFRVASVTVEPQTVQVQGDADEILELVTANTRAVSIAGARDDVSLEVGLDLPIGAVALEVESVTVSVRIEPVTETRTYAAGIRLAGARDDRVYVLSVDRVLVTLFGPVAVLDQVERSPFVATVDVAGLEPGTHEVQVAAQVPPELTVADTAPASVSVTVSIPATPPPEALPTPPPSAVPSPSPSS